MSSLSLPLFSARIVLRARHFNFFANRMYKYTSGIKVDLAEENAEFMEGRLEKWCQTAW